MAANPFDQFDAPAAAPKANPFDQFDPSPKTAAPSTPAASSDTPASFNQGPPTLGQMSVFEKPADASWKDFMLAHLGEWGKGLGQIGGALSDYARVAGNTYGGALDRALADQSGFRPAASGQWVQGGDIPDLPAAQAAALAAEKAKTAAASERLGTAGTIAANMTGGGPLGKLTEGVSGVFAPYLGKWGGGVLGSGAITAGATATSEAASGEGLSPSDIAISGGIGLLSGVPGGIGRGGRGGASPAAVDLATLKANKTGAYQKLGGVLYDNADVRQAATNAINEIGQREPRIARNGKGALDVLNEIGNNQALGKGVQSGEDINDIIRSLKKVNTGDAVDEAGQIAQRHFNSLLDNTAPITGGPSNSGRQALDEANEAYGRLQDTQRLADMQDKAATAGTDVGSQASSFLASAKGQKLAAQPGWENQLGAFQRLADTTAKPDTIPWYVKHFIIAPALGTGANELYAGFTGQERSPWEHLAADAAVGGGLMGASALGGGLTARLNQAAQNRAIAAARVALSTGQKPALPAAPWRDALRALIYSRGASGAY